MVRITAELAAFLPAHGDLHTEAEIVRVRGWLPAKVPNGHWLQPSVQRRRQHTRQPARDLQRVQQPEVQPCLAD